MKGKEQTMPEHCKEYSPSLMMLFVSEGGKRGKADFESQLKNMMLSDRRCPYD
jgi:hypothetical protein